MPAQGGGGSPLPPDWPHTRRPICLNSCLFAGQPGCTLPWQRKRLSIYSGPVYCKCAAKGGLSMSSVPPSVALSISSVQPSMALSISSVQKS